MSNSAYIKIDNRKFNRENKINLILEGTDPKSFVDEVHDRLKYINENFFYNKLVIKAYDTDSFSISTSYSDNDSFPIYVSSVLEEYDEYQIEFSHKQSGRFMWYISWVMLKELSVYFNQDKIYDEGVGDIPISDMKTHEPSKDLDTLKENMYKSKDWDKEVIWCGDEEMIKFFDLDRVSKLKKFVTISKEVIKLTAEISKDIKRLKK
mgnify:CR=1 FL=1